MDEAATLSALPPWARELLDETPVARLATIAPNGRARLVPVCYAIDGDGRIAIAIDEKPKRTGELARVRDIVREPRVTLLVDHYDDDWTRLAWVRVEGTATVLERGDAWPSALAALRHRYAQYATMALEERPVIAITIERALAWRWR